MGNGYAQLADFPLATGVNDGDTFYTDNANTVTEQRTTAKQFSTYVLNGLAPQRQSIPVTAAGQSAYVTQGYMPTLINVFVAGFRLNPSQYQALDGINVIITDAQVLGLIVTGMTVDIDAVVSIAVAGVATPASVAALDPANQPAIGAIAGTEIVSTRQGAALFQTSLTKLAQWALGTFNGFLQNGTGAIARNVLAKLTDGPVSPEDFGAMGNGVANDTGAFVAALAASKSVRCQAGKRYMVANLVIGVNQTLDLNGAMLAAATGANWIVKTNGFGSKVRNGQLDDALNNTLVNTATTVAVMPGQTQLSVINGTNFLTGELVVTTLQSGRPWVSKVVSSNAISVTLLDPVPYSPTSAPISAGGLGYVVGDQIVVLGGTGVPTVLQVTSIGTAGAITGVSILDPGHGGTPPTNPASVTGGSGTGAQFNLVQAGVAIGGTVQTGQGLLVCDQAEWADHDNILITNAPVAVHVKNSLGAAGNTAQNKFQGIKTTTVPLCSLYLDVNASIQHFETCDFFATPVTGAVGVYQEGRNSVLATGGHNFTNVNVLQGWDGWVLKGAQLSDYIACVSDTLAGTAFDIVNGSWGALRFSHCFAGDAANGVVVANSPQVFFNQLWTKLNTGYDLCIDAASTVWLEDQTWGPSRKTGGAGTYNHSQAFSLGGGPGQESLRVIPAAAGATNRWNMAGALTGNGPTLSVSGVDANPNGYIQNAGSGSIYFQAGAGYQSIFSYSKYGFVTYAPVIDAGTVFEVPTTGFAITFNASNSSFVLVPASQLATGSCALPQYPANGQKAEISCSVNGVTAMTWTAQGTGATVVGAPAGLTAGRTVAFKYNAANNTWVCVSS